MKYDPKTRDAFDLRSDWDEFVKKYKAHSENPETLEEAKAMMGEIFEREVATFKPDGMKPHAEELFWKALKGMTMKRLKLPAHQVRSVAVGRKSLIIGPSVIKTNVPVWLVSEKDEVYAVLKLHKPIELDRHTFSSLVGRHLVSEDECDKRWEDVETFWAYEFSTLAKFGSRPWAALFPEDGTTVMKQVKGRTSTEEGHDHAYDVSEEGTGSTSTNNDHRHEVTEWEVEEANGHEHTIQPPSKAFSIQKDFEEDPKAYTDQQLMFWFNALHDLYWKVRDGEKVQVNGKAWDLEDITQYYAKVVVEMEFVHGFRAERFSELDQDADEFIWSLVREMEEAEAKEDGESSSP